eukprot:1013769-Amphidinium_carterae.1
MALRSMLSLARRVCTSTRRPHCVNKAHNDKRTHTDHSPDLASTREIKSGMSLLFSKVPPPVVCCRLFILGISLACSDCLLVCRTAVVVIAV